VSDSTSFLTRLDSLIRTIPLFSRILFFLSLTHTHVNCKTTTYKKKEFDHLILTVLEKKKRLRPHSHPNASELLSLGSVWLINETAYTRGLDTHATRLHPHDAEQVPDWSDMTLRVHYVPDRYHMAHEVDWAKYCRGLLVGGNVEVMVGDDKPHVPMKGLPDSNDGAVLYEVSRVVGSYI